MQMVFSHWLSAGLNLFGIKKSLRAITMRQVLHLKNEVES